MKKKNSDVDFTKKSLMRESQRMMKEYHHAG